MQRSTRSLLRSAATQTCRPRAPISVQASRPLFSLSDISKLAGMSAQPSQAAPGSSGSRGVETDGEEMRFHARKILPYTQAQLYSLVSDVPSYSAFIPFCQSSTVLAPLPPGAPAKSRRRPRDWTPGEDAFEVEAELKVGFGGLEERYISKVVGRPFESVTATASEQTPLFKSLITTWSFSPASSLSPHASASNPGQSPSSSSASSSSTSRTPNSTTPASPHQGPTLLNIDLSFAFANPLHRIASQAVLPRVADKMVEAFEKRCVEVWGKGQE